MYLLVGKSGSGKSTIARFMEKEWGYKELKSYTTRQPRYEGEDTHIFISHDDFQRYKDNNEIVAYSFFNGEHYFCTRTQLYYNDVYVIDPDGIEYLKQRVDDIYFITIYIDVPFYRRMWRMWRRGDSLISILQRLWNDRIKFANVQYDYRINNIDIIDALVYIKSITRMHNYINENADELLELLYSE